MASGRISSTKNPNNNSFFETALAIADSIIYEKSDDIRGKPSSRFPLIHYSDHLKYSIMVPLTLVWLFFSI